MVVRRYSKDLRAGACKNIPLNKRRIYAPELPNPLPAQKETLKRPAPPKGQSVMPPCAAKPADKAYKIAARAKLYPEFTSIGSKLWR